jgi:hypothetical protein
VRGKKTEVEAGVRGIVNCRKNGGFMAEPGERQEEYCEPDDAAEYPSAPLTDEAA